jgi:DNA-binding LacI/PurR family transcriptional regulator
MEAEMKRPTIGDIARRAGLSKAAVSYALNGRPGVSEETRDRVSRIAHALGWRPNTAALALSGERAGVVGLVVAGPVSWATVGGIERELAGAGIVLQLAIAQGVEAEETYRDWWASRRVDGVLVIDLEPGDQRIPLLRNLNVPAAVLGNVPVGTSCLRLDRARAWRTVIGHLRDRGHQSIAYLGDCPVDDPQVIHAQAWEAVRGQVSAMVFEDPLQAVKVVAHAAEHGFRVPDDLAVVAWEDAPACELVHPNVTAVRHDEAAHGAAVARLLLNQLTTGTPEQTVISTGVLIARATT